MTQFKTVAAKRDAVAAYFADHERPTFTGLAQVFGMSRRAFATYAGSDQILIDARMQIEAYLEDRVNSSGVNGAMLNLKTNFGWDKPCAVAPAPRVETRRASEMSDDELAAFLTRDRERL